MLRYLEMHIYLAGLISIMLSEAKKTELMTSGEDFLNRGFTICAADIFLRVGNREKVEECATKATIPEIAEDIRSALRNGRKSVKIRSGIPTSLARDYSRACGANSAVIR
jgi:hypothetical protein